MKRQDILVSRHGDKLRHGWSGIRLPAEARNFTHSTACRPALVPHRPPIIPRVFPEGIVVRGETDPCF